MRSLDTHKVLVLLFVSLSIAMPPHSLETCGLLVCFIPLSNLIDLAVMFFWGLGFVGKECVVSVNLDMDKARIG